MNALGKAFEENNSFDEDLLLKISYLYNLSDYSFVMIGLLKLTYMLGTDRYGWDMMLKRNKAFENRFDKPFYRTCCFDYGENIILD